MTDRSRCSTPSPPRLSLVSFAALCASDAVIIPMEAADWGAQGIMQVTAAIVYAQRHYHPRLELLGYLVSRFKRARAYQQSYLRQLRQHFGEQAFDTVIPDLAQFEKSVPDRVPITLHARRSDAPSSTKSSAASKGTVAAAEAAAHRAFSTLPTLPLDQDTLAHGTALEGRQRLTGAFLIDVARIRPDPDQPRRACDTQAQWELSASIAKVGILQPITVRYIERDNVYQVITGERRFQAAKALGLSAIPCWMKTPKADDILVHQIVENWQRRDLEPLELARALALLRDSTGSSQKALAALTGKPESEVSRLLSLLKLTPDVQAQAEETPRGTVTKRHLVALAQLPPEDQQEVMIAVREKHLTALDTEHVAREAKAKETGVTSRGAPLTQRLRYLTANALVTLTFRRRNVTAQDILAALDAVREQVTKARDEDRASA